jgi:hypothetical protein
MTIRPLSAEETRQNNFTHIVKINHLDLNDTAATTKTLSLITGLRAGHIVTEAAFRLITPFDGGATTALVLDVGYDLAAGADDPDAILDNYQIHLDATEIFAGDGNGAIFAANRTGYAFQESAKITALFTATNANLSTLTTGEVAIFLSVLDLNTLV